MMMKNIKKAAEYKYNNRFIDVSIDNAFELNQFVNG